MTMLLCCKETNDLYRALVGSGISCARFDRLEDALDAAQPGEGLLLLADGNPRSAFRMDGKTSEETRRKQLKVYLEYPHTGFGTDYGEPTAIQWERLVAVSDYFSPEVEQLAILNMHGSMFAPIVVPESMTVHLALARVAGYDKAVFGLPENPVPILLESPDRSVLIAASGLSRFVSGRYAPTAAWRAVWKRILEWLGYGEAAAVLQWEPAVGVQYDKEASLPDQAEALAFDRVMTWFSRYAVYSIDAHIGVIEGFESTIRPNGRQLMRPRLRADCIAESAMAFAHDFAVTGNPESRFMAEKMMNTIWSGPDFYNNEPNEANYGLVNWYDRRKVYYGDDNARVILACLSTRNLLADDRWDEAITHCLLANFRTSGTQGFRRPFLQAPRSFAGTDGWKKYYEEDYTLYSPHYQSYLWACNLWVYAMTGYELFLKRTKQAIRQMMEAYPSQWNWTNGMTQEIARMLLPLSFLVQVEDTEQHRLWLKQMADELLMQMQPCGSIREHLGALEQGRYAPPVSNEQFGSREAPLLQENGDPVCDLLYTANWGLIGLHEAAATTGDGHLREAADRLTSFMLRIQIRSQQHPYLDGAWMRGFDDEKWEYWGSSADCGWGPWCVETGWTNSWIASVLSMRIRSERLFDTSAAASFRQLMPGLLEEMGLKSSLSDREHL
ncbi:hypothetical protein [Paenibacillus oceani]|uniref:Uncharacterized protein n=1 Tax=Paenibacillus oceani TaxID=2772510 RepID=A0A927H0V9_9BACL|nr:hypothetical protein [Paenibacillus oceani]MBD2862864.1 hypothetical protein [Paenibacillus oceani]